MISERIWTRAQTKTLTQTLARECKVLGGRGVVVGGVSMWRFSDGSWLTRSGRGKQVRYSYGDRASAPSALPQWVGEPRLTRAHVVNRLRILAQSERPGSRLWWAADIAYRARELNETVFQDYAREILVYLDTFHGVEARAIIDWLTRMADGEGVRNEVEQMRLAHIRGK